MMTDTFLKDRSPIAWLRERDVDLALCIELHSCKEFQQWFLRTALGQEKDLAGAWVSVSDGQGETDLLILCGDGEALLIENKIDAGFQPHQAERYRLRGDAGIREGSWTHFRTCLLAPSIYIDRTSSDLFDLHLKYEQVLSWYEGRLDPRSRFMQRFLTTAIEQGRTGWQLVPHAPTTDFWQSYWQLAIEQFPELEMPRPDAKPSGSTWPYFRRAGLPKGVVIIHKTTHGFVDLSFSQTKEADLHQRCQGLLEAGMEIRQTKGSAVIRCNVARIDPAFSFSEQQSAIAASLHAASRLLRFFHTHREALLPR